MVHKEIKDQQVYKVILDRRVIKALMVILAQYQDRRVIKDRREDKDLLDQAHLLILHPDRRVIKDQLVYKERQVIQVQNWDRRVIKDRREDKDLQVCRE